MKLIQPAIKFAAQAALATILASASFAQSSSLECKEIMIDSVGMVGFKDIAIEAIAPHEIGGLALFVLVRPPTSRLQKYDDVLRITVGANIVPRHTPSCRRVFDVLDKKEMITCFLSLRGNELQIAVQYKIFDTITIAANYEDRTMIIADYISDQVLCKAQKSQTHL